MRPECLYPLFAPVTALAGVGPRLAPLVEKAAGPHVVDLLWHLPTGLVDRRFIATVRDAPIGGIATFRLTVDSHVAASSPRTPYRVLCSDHTGTLTLVFFHAKADWLKKTLPIGSERIVSGLVERFNEAVQIVHPDHIVPPERLVEVAAVEPMYRCSGRETLLRR